MHHSTIKPYFHLNLPRSTQNLLLSKICCRLCLTTQTWSRLCSINQIVNSWLKFSRTHLQIYTYPNLHDHPLAQTRTAESDGEIKSNRIPSIWRASKNKNNCSNHKGEWSQQPSNNQNATPTPPSFKPHKHSPKSQISFCKFLLFYMILSNCWKPINVQHDTCVEVLTR